MFKYLLENKDTSIIIELIENANITNIEQTKKTTAKYPQIGEEKKRMKIIEKVPKSFIIVFDKTDNDMKIQVKALKEISKKERENHGESNVHLMTESKYKLFRKLSLYFEQRYKLLYETDVEESKFNKFTYYIRYIKSYKDLFNKTCQYCKRKAKYNPIEKVFYPPYYKMFLFEDNDVDFYHEECFNIINNKSH
jgi:hypothetical protein